MSAGRIEREPLSAVTQRLALSLRQLGVPTLSVGSALQVRPGRACGGGS